MDAKLSPKQAKILSFIERELSRYGRPPTYRAIAEHCGYDAVGTVQDHVSALIKKGFLEKEAGVSRGIRLPNRSESIDVPILGSVPAGKPIEAMEDAQGALPAPASKGRGDVYALKVTGESMIEAGIMDGDFVLVRKQSQADNGDIIVAMIDGEATVKYFEKKSGRTRLMPANPRFSPIEIPEGSENFVAGKVIGVQRYY